MKNIEIIIYSLFSCIIIVNISILVIRLIRTIKNRWKLGHHHYRPIGTEWDFAPEWAVSVYPTDITGKACWIDRAGEEDTDQGVMFE